MSWTTIGMAGRGKTNPERSAGERTRLIVETRVLHIQEVAKCRSSWFGKISSRALHERLSCTLLGMDHSFVTASIDRTPQRSPALLRYPREAPGCQTKMRKRNRESWGKKTYRHRPKNVWDTRLMVAKAVFQHQELQSLSLVLRFARSMAACRCTCLGEITHERWGQ